MVTTTYAPFRNMPSPGYTDRSVPAPAACYCAPSPTNAHWWMVAPAHSAASLGICCYCNESRWFVNYVDTQPKDGSKKLTDVGGADRVPPTVAELRDLRGVV